MADPAELQARLAQARQQQATALTQSQGWRELVLKHLLERVTQLDQHAMLVRLPTEARLDALGRKAELVEFVTLIYKLADLPNPFEVARLGLLTLTLPKDPPSPAAPPQGTTPLDEALRRRPRRMGGSVA